MASIALDLGLRGVAVGLFLLICAVVLLRDAPFRPAARLGGAMGVAGAAYAISTAPFFPMWSFGWNPPFVVLSMGCPVIFWLWARAVFDEDFALRPWHGAVWALVAGLGLVAYNSWTNWPTAAVTCGRMLGLATIGFALLAATQIPKGWRAVVVTGCGRLLVALIIGKNSTSRQPSDLPRCAMTTAMRAGRPAAPIPPSRNSPPPGVHRPESSNSQEFQLQ